LWDVNLIMLDVTGEGGLDVTLHTPCLLEQLGSLLHLCTFTLPSFSAQSKSALTLCDRQHVEWHNGVCVCTHTLTHTDTHMRARTQARRTHARTQTTYHRMHPWHKQERIAAGGACLSTPSARCRDALEAVRSKSKPRGIEDRAQLFQDSQQTKRDEY